MGRGIAYEACYTTFLDDNSPFALPCRLGPLEFVKHGVLAIGQDAFHYTSVIDAQYAGYVVKRDRPCGIVSVTTPDSERYEFRYLPVDGKWQQIRTYTVPANRRWWRTAYLASYQMKYGTGIAWLCFAVILAAEYIVCFFVLSWPAAIVAGIAAGGKEIRSEDVLLGFCCAPLAAAMLSYCRLARYHRALVSWGLLKDVWGAVLYWGYFAAVLVATVWVILFAAEQSGRVDQVLQQMKAGR